MVDYYIYAKHCSVSTERPKDYLSNGMEIFERFRSHVERMRRELLIAGEPPAESKIIYMHWGHICYDIGEEATKQRFIELKGRYECSEPNMVIKWMKQNYFCTEKKVLCFSKCCIATTAIRMLESEMCRDNNRIKLLYILTDGLSEPGSMNNCFELNKDIQYETVVFHAFSDDLKKIDKLVAASCFTHRCIVYQNNELIEDIDISEEFNYDKITVDNFKTDINGLKSYIRFKFMRISEKDELVLRELDKLKKLRDRLLDELSSKAQKSEVNLETKDRKMFLREFVRTDWYKSLNAPNQDAKIDVEKSISTLINYIVSDKKSYAFDALKFDTKFGDFVGEEPIIDVNFIAEQEIEFPDIIMADDRRIPVLILTEVNLLDKMIFCRTKELDKVSPASFNKFKSAMECPLFLMNDPDFSESIGDFYTLNVYKQLLKKTKKTEPRTRRPFYGGLVLTDTELFDEYNDYVLSATYFDSKKVNFNFGLFYFVLWKKCKNHKWIEENDIEQFKKYVMRRISTTVCKIGLSSLPLDPQENVSLPNALWYCVELSSCIFKDDPRNFMHERLRMFYGVAHWMVEILKYLNYDLDLASFVKRRELIKHVMILKDIPTRQDKVYYLLTGIFKRVNGFLVSEIEKPYNLNTLNYLKMHHKDMLRDDVMEEKVNLNDYVHLMQYVSDLGEFVAGEGMFRICRKTFRRFVTIEENKSFSAELVKVTRKIVINNPDERNRIRITYDPIDSLEFDKASSRYILFVDCVRSFGKYPTLPEFIEYISKEKKFNSNWVTIFPRNIYYDAEDVYLRFQNIVTKVDVNNFVKDCSNCIQRSEQIKAQRTVNEIERYLQN